MRKIVLIVLLFISFLNATLEEYTNCQCYGTHGSWDKNDTEYIGIYFFVQEPYHPEEDLYTCTDNNFRTLERDVVISGGYQTLAYRAYKDTETCNCTEPSDLVPDPPKDTNTTKWELLAFKSCKDNTPLPDICTDNNESNATILLQSWKTGCCGTNTKCWQAEKPCDQNDTQYTPKDPAENEVVVFEWTDPADMSQQCRNLNGSEQTKRVKCKTVHRCLTKTEEPPKICPEEISSYVSPRDGVFHEDIEVTGANFRLHYSSANLDDTNIAHGWSISSHARMVANRVYFGSGSIYQLVIAGREDNLTLVASGSSEFLFNDDGNLVQTRDLYTKEPKITFSYDNSGRLVTLTDIYGEITTIERDSNGIATAIVAPTGQRTLLQVDNNGDLMEVQYEDTTSYNFEYEHHLMTVETEPKGNRFLHFFDADAKVIKVIDAEQGVWEFNSVSQERFGTHTVTRASGDVVTYKNHFLKNGILTSEKTLPTGDVILYENAIDDTSSTTTSCGMKTTNLYKKNAYGTLLDPYSYRRILESTTITTPSGLSKVIRYNKQYTGRIKQIETNTTINTKRFSTQKDYTTHSVTHLSAEGKRSTETYDAKMQKLLTLTPYDVIPTTYTYDDKGRVTKEQTGTRITRYLYDDKDHLVRITDPKGKQVHYSYDLKGRLSSVTQPSGDTLHYTYDANGNMTLLSTATPTDHTFSYNAVNKPTGYIAPLGGTTRYAYDKQRRLTTVTKPSGKHIDYRYLNGRLTEVTTPEATTTYRYVCQSYPSSITKGNENFSFTYDGTLLTHLIQGGLLNQTITYTYNNDFLPSSISYAGATTSLSYNKDNQLLQSGAFGLSYAPRQSTLTDGNFTQKRFYNKYGELWQQNDDLFTYKVYRRKDGKIYKKIEILNGKTVTYAYKYLKNGQLGRVFKNGKIVEDYTYDANGNRLTATSTLRGVKKQIQSYNENDQIKLLGQFRQKYDADGYLSTKSIPSNKPYPAPPKGIMIKQKRNVKYKRFAPHDTYTFAYGTQGELLSVTTPTSTGSATTKTITYEQNALNQRVAKLVDGVVVEKYLWANLTTLLAVYDKDDNLVQRFEYADGRMPVAMTMGTQKYYLHYDQVGSLRAVSDTNGNVVKEITYDTFGNILSDSNPDFKVPFGFAGGLYDADTKLTRFGYRDYDAYTGKWTAKDPVGFSGGDSNLYGYVWADPVNWIDTEGLRGRAAVRRGRGGIGGIGGGRAGTYPPYFPSSSSSTLGESISNAINNLLNCDKNKNDCQALYYQINRYVNQLQRRFRQYRTDLGNLGESGQNSREGHREKIKNVQKRLRRLLTEANSKGCINYREDAWHWATRPIAY